MANEVWEYISAREYMCSHCGKLPPGLVRTDDGSWPLIFEYLFTRFADIREAWGRPIQITSGYRCPAHNKAISGTELGTHVFGLALDLAVNLDEMDAMVGIIDAVHPELRVGTNRKPGHIHIHTDVGYLIHPIYSDKLVEGLRFEE